MAAEQPLPGILIRDAQALERRNQRVERKLRQQQKAERFDLRAGALNAVVVEPRHGRSALTAVRFERGPGRATRTVRRRAAGRSGVETSTEQHWSRVAALRP
jgi:hypothetical protein